MKFQTRSDGRRIGPITIDWILSKCSIDPVKGCWIWSMQRFWDGYGRVKYKGRAERVHRIAWEISNGPISEGVKILHKCDNPPCCNPDHLFDGTHQDNLIDCVKKGRHRWNKLLPHVEEIIISSEPLDALASRFGVTVPAIRAIRNRKVYRWMKL